MGHQCGSEWASERARGELFKSSYVVCKFWICPRLASIKRITTFVWNIFNTGAVISGMFGGAFRVLCLLTCQSVFPFSSCWLKCTRTHTHTSPQPPGALGPDWWWRCAVQTASTLASALSALGACLSQGRLREVYLNGLCFPVTPPPPPFRAGRSPRPFHPGRGPPRVSTLSEKNGEKKEKGGEEGQGDVGKKIEKKKGGQRLRWA